MMFTHSEAHSAIPLALSRRSTHCVRYQQWPASAAEKIALRTTQGVLLVSALLPLAAPGARCCARDAPRRARALALCSLVAPPPCLDRCMEQACGRTAASGARLGRAGPLVPRMQQQHVAANLLLLLPRCCPRCCSTAAPRGSATPADVVPCRVCYMRRETSTYVQEERISPRLCVANYWTWLSVTKVERCRIPATNVNTRQGLRSSANGTLRAFV